MVLVQYSSGTLKIKYLKGRQLKGFLGAGIKDMNRIAKCGCDHSCLMKESLSCHSDYII
jgi:hypothetical protein